MELKHITNSLIPFSINDNPVFNNGPGGLPRNPPDFVILDNWVFDTLTTFDELFAKALQTFATCVLVINNLCWKLV